MIEKYLVLSNFVLISRLAYASNIILLVLNKIKNIDKLITFQSFAVIIQLNKFRLLVREEHFDYILDSLNQKMIFYLWLFIKMREFQKYIILFDVVYSVSLIWENVGSLERNRQHWIR